MFTYCQIQSFGSFALSRTLELSQRKSWSHPEHPLQPDGILIYPESLTQLEGTCDCLDSAKEPIATRRCFISLRDEPFQSLQRTLYISDTGESSRDISKCLEAFELDTKLSDCRARFDDEAYIQKDE